MTEADLNRLFSLFRVLPPFGAGLLLVEWLGGLALVPLAFRWGIPVIRRRLEVRHGSRGPQRTSTRALVVAPLPAGGWIFRAPVQPFGVHTPFPLYGSARQDGHSVHVVGRHPVGGGVFLLGAIGNSVLAALAPLLVPSLAAEGFSPQFSKAGVYVALAVALYASSLAIERLRFLRALGELHRLLEEA